MVMNYIWTLYNTEIKKQDIIVPDKQKPNINYLANLIQINRYGMIAGITLPMR